MANSRRKSMLSRFSSPLKDNPVYSGLFGAGKGGKKGGDGEEEICFYYLMVMCQLHDRRRLNSSMYKE